MRTLEEVLRSVSDVMFPEQMGAANVLIDSHGYDGDTALHVLTWRNDFEGVEVLLNAGADVNARGEMQDTPLHVAVMQDNPQLAALFIAHGADPDLRSEFGSARELAHRSGGAIEALFRDGA